MNIEFEEVVVQDVSDEALELAAGSSQVGGLKLAEFATGTGSQPSDCKGCF